MLEKIYKQNYIVYNVELVSVKGVCKEFGDHLVLDNINLTINEGDIYGIIGKSGSGKSTLLNALVGFLEVDEGVVFYHTATGKKILLNENKFKIKKRIGFASQKISFYPKLTVKENLLHFGRMYNLDDKVLIENAKNLLHFTGLMSFRNNLAEGLSGGMQKRLDIACSLIQKPKLLVLDEPVMHLDPALKREILKLIREVNKQGITVVMASHDLESIESICEKVAILYKGEIHVNSSVEDLRCSFSENYGQINLKSIKYHDLLLDFVKSLSVEKIIDRKNNIILKTKDLERTTNQLVSFIKNHDLQLNNLEVSQPSLKKIFEEVTKDQLID